MMKVVRSLNLAERSALAVFIASSLVMVIKLLILNETPSLAIWLNRLSPMGDSVLTSLSAGSLFFLVVMLSLIAPNLAKFENCGDTENCRDTIPIIN